MNDKIKLALQLLALIVTAFVGYGVASTSVKKLNDQVSDTTLELGALKQQIKNLGGLSVDLETQSKAIQQSVEAIRKTDIAQVSDFLSAINAAVEPKAFIKGAASLDERISRLEAKQLACVAIPTEDHQGFAGCVDGFYELAKWCSGDCSGDDARLVVCCKP